MNAETRIVDLIEKTRPYDGFFKIDRYRLRHGLPDGGMSDEIVRENFERGHAAAVLVYDETLDQVLLVEEFRIGNYAAGMTGEAAWSLAPMAGGIEPGETGLDCVIREAREEAGIILDPARIDGPWTYLSSPGGTSEVLEIYVARARLDSADAALIDNDADEVTRPVVVGLPEVMRLIEQGRVPASLMVATLWLMRQLGR